MRLDILADEARQGLKRIEEGEDFTIGGWLAYGHALNEGRALFPGDREFGEWVRLSNLDERNGQEVHPGDRQAAMWAAANADQFEEARQRGNPRTIRGIHSKWKEIEKEREQAEWEEQQRKMVEERKAAAQEPALDDSIETPSAKQAKPEAQPAPLKADAENGGDGAGEPDQVEATQTDPHSKLRAEFQRMTDEAREDDWIGLRVEVEEGRKRIASQRSEIADLKARIKEITEGNQGATISKLQKQVAAVKMERDDAKAATKRIEYRMKMLAKERDEALAKLGEQVVTL